jgi:hypothetical protein
MYNSQITASELIDSVRSEADISIDIPESIFLRTINTVEQFIYTEILKEYVTETIPYSNVESFSAVDFREISVPSEASTPIFDDVIKVFADGDELERAGASAVFEFKDKNLYYDKYNGKITLSLVTAPNNITILYRIRPALKSAVNKSTSYIALPIEFVEIIASKLRGEMYKIANEDGLSAKWLSEYNVQLEKFKIWAAVRMARFGG